MIMCYHSYAVVWLIDTNGSLVCDMDILCINLLAIFTFKNVKSFKLNCCGDEFLLREFELNYASPLWLFWRSQFMSIFLVWYAFSKLPSYGGWYSCIHVYKQISDWRLFFSGWLVDHSCLVMIIEFENVTPCWHFNSSWWYGPSLTPPHILSLVMIIEFGNVRPCWHFILPDGMVHH